MESLNLKTVTRVSIKLYELCILYINLKLSCMYLTTIKMYISEYIGQENAIKYMLV